MLPLADPIGAELFLRNLLEEDHVWIFKELEALATQVLCEKEYEGRDFL